MVHSACEGEGSDLATHVRDATNVPTLGCQKGTIYLSRQNVPDARKEVFAQILKDVGRKKHENAWINKLCSKRLLAKCTI